MRRICVRDIAQSNLHMHKEVAEYLVKCVQKGQIQRALAIVDWNCLDDVDQVGVLLQVRQEYVEAISNKNLEALERLLSLDKLHLQQELESVSGFSKE